MAEDTLFVFTSDHGDMLGSQGEVKKQRPWEESIRVPFLLRWPQRFGWEEAPALMPCWIRPTFCPHCSRCAGFQYLKPWRDATFSPTIEGGPDPSDGAALLYCPHPFGQFTRQDGGREYRGLRTRRHTFVRDIDGPWLLYDNQDDPYQLQNLVDRPEVRSMQARLDAQLRHKLDERGDEFLPGMAYIQKWGYPLDETGTVPYEW